MKENWNKENLERYWQLDERDQEFLNYKKEENKLICAVKIKYLTLTILKTVLFYARNWI